MTIHSHHSQSSSTNLVFPQSKESRQVQAQREEQQRVALTKGPRGNQQSTAQKITRPELVTEARQPVQGSSEVSDNSGNVGRQGAGARGQHLLTGANQAKSKTDMRPTQTYSLKEKVQQDKRPAANKNDKPQGEAKKAIMKTEATSPQASSPKHKQRQEKINAVIKSNRPQEEDNRKSQPKPTRVSSSTNKQRQGKPISALKNGRQHDSTTLEQEPSETIVINKELKEMAAKKRAAIAKKKGALQPVESTGHKASSSSRKAESDSKFNGSSSRKAKSDARHKVSSSSRKAVSDKSRKVTSDETKKVRSSSIKASSDTSRKASNQSLKMTSDSSFKAPSTHSRTISDGESVATGPKAKKITSDSQGTKQDPPGATRKAVNDDATIAPLRNVRNRHSALLAPMAANVGIQGRQQQKDQPKSILRQDLLEVSKVEDKISSSVLGFPDLSPLADCTGRSSRQRTDSPTILRPCDIPRGSEVKKKDEESTDFITDSLKALGWFYD